MSFTPEEAKIWNTQNVHEKEEEINKNSRLPDDYVDEWGFLNQETDSEEEDD